MEEGDEEEEYVHRGREPGRRWERKARRTDGGISKYVEERTGERNERSIYPAHCQLSTARTLSITQPLRRLKPARLIDSSTP